jgi:hypothetical protein
MAWHIVFFLKSLRILEEFRKNPCVKIPPKSSCANFQSLGKFKNPIFILKRIFLQFQPSRSSRPAGLFGLSAQWPSAQPVEWPACRANPPATDPFPLPSPTQAGVRAAASPARHPRHVRHLLSPTGATELQRPALPPLNSIPHQLTAITPPPPLDSGNQFLQAKALTPAMKPRCPPPSAPPIKG